MGRAMLTVGLVVVAMYASAAAGQPTSDFRCIVCTCENPEAIVCLQQEFVDEPQEGPCGSACSNVGSSFDDIDVFQTSCLEVLACNGERRGAPAAGPLWLSAGALGMLVFGGLALRRSRATRA